jgi:hypothetical protein
LVVINAVNNTVVTLPYSPEARAFYLFCAARPGVFSQFFDIFYDGAKIIFTELV